MADVNVIPHSKRSKCVLKPANRRTIRVDLTPMVDLGFLLITFFVFTSTMSIPKAMNLIEPVDQGTKMTKLSGALTILLGANHKLYYYPGCLADHAIAAEVIKTDFKAIRYIILKKKKATSVNDLMYIIKAGKNATFGDDVNLLDEMTICNIPMGHYAEVDITQKEADLISLPK